MYAWSADASDAGLLVNAESLSVQVAPRLVPVGLVPSRKAFGVWTALHGYDKVLKRLADKVTGCTDLGTHPEAPDWDATFVAVGYDFRLGVVDAAERVHEQITARVERLWPRPEDRAGRVVVVGHSMGGLVARYWAGVLDEQGWCQGVVTLGTPHRGAPKALDVLANGLPAPWATSRLTDVLRGWQGMYDLLPRYPAVLTRKTDQAPGTEGSSLLRVSELPLPWNSAMVTAAEQMHAHIDAGWELLGLDAPGLSYRVGFGHPTLQRCTLKGRRVRVAKLAAAGPGMGAWAAVGGDGTVPGFCAVPIGRDNDTVTDVTSGLRHSPLVATPDTDALLADACRLPGLGFYREAESVDVTVGLDVPTLIEAGQPVPVQAQLWRRSAAAGIEEISARHHAAQVWASVKTVDPSGTPATGVMADVALRWDPEQGAFTGVLPPMAPGLADVVVSAPSLTDLPATETVQVVRPGAGE